MTTASSYSAEQLAQLLKEAMAQGGTQGSTLNEVMQRATDLGFTGAQLGEATQLLGNQGINFGTVNPNAPLPNFNAPPAQTPAAAPSVAQTVSNAANVDQSPMIGSQNRPNINALPMVDGYRYDAANGYAYMPEWSQGSYNGADNYTPGEITGYRGYKFTPGEHKGTQWLLNTPFNTYDTAGNLQGSDVWTKQNSGVGDNDPLLNNPALGIAAPFLMAGGMAGLQSMGMFSGAANPVTSGAFGTGNVAAGGVGGAGSGLSYMNPISGTNISANTAGMQHLPYGQTTAAGTGNAGSSLSQFGNTLSGAARTAGQVSNIAGGLMSGNPLQVLGAVGAGASMLGGAMGGGGGSNTNTRQTTTGGQRNVNTSNGTTRTYPDLRSNFNATEGGDDFDPGQLYPDGSDERNDLNDAFWNDWFERQRNGGVDPNTLRLPTQTITGSRGGGGLDAGLGNGTYGYTGRPQGGGAGNSITGPFPPYQTGGGQNPFNIDFGSTAQWGGNSWSQGGMGGQGGQGGQGGNVTNNIDFSQLGQGLGNFANQFGQFGNNALDKVGQAYKDGAFLGENILSGIKEHDAAFLNAITENSKVAGMQATGAQSAMEQMASNLGVSMSDLGKTLSTQFGDALGQMSGDNRQTLESLISQLGKANERANWMGEGILSGIKEHDAAYLKAITDNATQSEITSRGAMDQLGRISENMGINMSDLGKTLSSDFSDALGLMSNNQRATLDQMIAAQQAGQTNFLDYLKTQSANAATAAQNAANTNAAASNRRTDVMGSLGLAGLLSQIAGSKRNAEAGDRMNTWINEELAKQDQLYRPGTAEYDLLKQEMERKDAAAGRNSQYGTRLAEMGAKIASIKGDQRSKMIPQLAQAKALALNQNANAYAGIPAQFMNLANGGGGGLIDNISSLIDDLFGGDE